MVGKALGELPNGGLTLGVFSSQGKTSVTAVNFHQNGTPSPSKLVLRGEYFQHPHPVSPHPSHRISVLFGAAGDLFLKL